jgi:hypothetical protein
MSRLPVIGGDADNWGTILNDFLDVAHAADGTLAPPISTGTARFALDTSQQSGMVIAANAIANPFGNVPNFAGIFAINDPMLTGATALFICGGGFVTKIAEGNSINPTYTTAKDTANKINVYMAPGNYVEIQNKWPNSMRACVTAIRMRDSA